jgi:hypothetical protein
MFRLLSNLSPHHSMFTHVGRLTTDSTESESRQTLMIF